MLCRIENSPGKKWSWYCLVLIGVDQVMRVVMMWDENGALESTLGERIVLSCWHVVHAVEVGRASG